MTEVILTKVAHSFDGPLPACLRIGDLVHRIKSRAYQLFQARGEELGHELEDWLQAETEMTGHALVAFHETDEGFEVHFLVPGFEARHIVVAISPSEVGIDARNLEAASANEQRPAAWREFSASEAFRRVKFPQLVDIDSATAEVKDGVLRVRVNKHKAL